MLDLYLEGIVSSVDLAATIGRLPGEQAVRLALEKGQCAAQHGRAIPLPILLDVGALLKTPHFTAYTFRSERIPQPAEMVAYDNWLLDFCRNARRSLGIRPTLRVSETILSEPDYLPLLLYMWPSNMAADSQPVKWAEAYGSLWDKSEYIQRIYAAWIGPRSTDKALWQKWFPAELNDQFLSPAPVMWGKFSSDARSAWLHENFDHAAAYLYLEAEDPPILPNQQQRIQQLIRRRQQYTSVSVTTGYEEQDPYHGAIALVTLCYGSHGDFQIVNGTAPRISNPPSSLPHGPLHIHVCWAIASAGLTQDHVLKVLRPERLGRRPAPVSETAEMARGRVTESSTLQGIVALLLDDWRYALRNLPVHFYAHKGPPNPQADHLGMGGERWKKSAKAQGPSPSPQTVAKFFERPNWVKVGSEGLRWDMHPNASEWWCACLLKRDLAEFGFHVHQEDTPTAVSGGEVWVAYDSSLPRCVSHVILIEPPDGAGSICRVMRTPDGTGRITLLPMHNRPGPIRDSDPSYITLRLRALDVVLDILEATMR